MADLPGDIRQTPFCLQRPRTLDHRRREIDARGMCHRFGECADNNPRSASDIKDDIARRSIGQLQQQLERVLILYRGSRRERNGLFGELVTDQVLMIRHATSTSAVSMYAIP